MYIKTLPHFEGLELPRYETPGAAGMDLRAAIEHPITLDPMDRVLIPTGLEIDVGAGYEGQIRSRSGLAWNAGLFVLNSPGTIDSDYRGEIKVILINLDPIESVTIERGDRIAQLVISKVTQSYPTFVLSLDPTERMFGGFGSTGVK